MNSIDIILSIFLIFGLIRGFFKGFLTELAGLLGLIAGIYAAIHYSGIMYAFLEGFISWNERYLLIIAFALTFFLVALLIIIVGRILTKMLNLIALGIVNKLAGAAFGFLKMAFFASLFFLLVNHSPAYNLGQETKEDSVLYEPVEDLAPLILPSIMKKIQEKDLFESTNQEENRNNLNQNK